MAATISQGIYTVNLDGVIVTASAGGSGGIYVTDLVVTGFGY